MKVNTHAHSHSHAHTHTHTQKKCQTAQEPGEREGDTGDGPFQNGQLLIKASRKVPGNFSLNLNLRHIGVSIQAPT